MKHILLSILLYGTNIASFFAVWRIGNFSLRKGEERKNKEEGETGKYPLLLLGISVWVFTTVLIIIRTFNYRIQLLGLNIISLWEYIISNPKWVVETIIVIFFLSLLLRIGVKIVLFIFVRKEGGRNPLLVTQFLCERFSIMNKLIFYNYNLHKKIFFQITGGKWNVSSWTIIFHFPLFLLIFSLIFDIKYNNGYLFLTIIAISFFFAINFIGDIHFKLLLFAPFGEDMNHGGGYLPPDQNPKHNREIIGPPMRTHTRFGITLREGIQYQKTTENIYQPAVKAWTRATYTKAGISVAATICLGCVILDNYLRKSEMEMIQGEYKILEAKYGETIKEIRENEKNPGYERVKFIDELESKRVEINEKPIGTRLLYNGGKFIKGQPKFKQITEK